MRPDRTRTGTRAVRNLDSGQSVSQMPCLEAESCLEHELAVSPNGQLSVVSCQLLGDKTPGGRRPLLAGAVELGARLLVSGDSGVTPVNDTNSAPRRSPTVRVKSSANMLRADDFTRTGRLGGPNNVHYMHGGPR